MIAVHFLQEHKAAATAPPDAAAAGSSTVEATAMDKVAPLWRRLPLQRLDWKKQL